MYILCAYLEWSAYPTYSAYPSKNKHWGTHIPGECTQRFATPASFNTISTHNFERKHESQLQRFEYLYSNKFSFMTQHRDSEINVLNLQISIQ